MAYDPGLTERVAESFASMGFGHVRQKNVFSGRGFMLGKSAAIIVWGDRLLVKTPPAEYDAALRVPGVVPFAPGGDRPMSTWVVVPPDTIADDPELAEWVRRGARALGR